MEAASRIFFSSGSLDPWSGLSPNATALHGAYGPHNPRGVVCYMMEGAAHHLDLRGHNDADPKVVKHVREIEKAYITAWLQDKDRPSEDELQQAMAAVQLTVGLSLCDCIESTAQPALRQPLDGHTRWAEPVDRACGHVIVSHDLTTLFDLTPHVCGDSEGKRWSLFV